MNYIKTQGLATPRHHILVAVSGGIDSMVMMHLFRMNRFAISLAHCNFQLRDRESEGDEQFIRKTAGDLDIPLWVKRFDTEACAREEGISIQMAARNLRYGWFEKLQRQYGFDGIALGHNRDDVMETFFINLIRGTGISGLSGIKPKSGSIIRPLLFLSRESIQTFAREHEIAFREDTSNESTKYTRNKIRHQIIPRFREINPNMDYTLINNMQHLHEVETIFHQAVRDAWSQIATEDRDVTEIDIAKMTSLCHPLKTYLFEFLKPYRVNETQLNNLLDTLKGEPGRTFYTPGHVIVKDRNKILIIKKKEEEDQNARYYIDVETTRVHHPIPLKLEVVSAHTYQIEKNQRTGQFDRDAVSFPLIIRRWRPGDYFYPLGMQGIKKLSDFFIDIKLPLPEKENLWLLTSGESIIWIMGYRIDDRFKVSSSTQKVLKIEMG